MKINYFPKLCLYLSRYQDINITKLYFISLKIYVHVKFTKFYKLWDISIIDILNALISVEDLWLDGLFICNLRIILFI